MSVLVITNREDVTSDLVIARLHEVGVGVFRLNTDGLCDSTSFDLHIDGPLLSGEISTAHHKISLGDIRSVYYRRPGQRKLEGVNPAYQDFVQQESSLFIRWLGPALSDRFWLSQPHLIRKAESKFAQLVSAARLGFITPATLCSNRFPSVQKFFQGKGEQIIAKPLGPGYIEEEKQRKNFYATQVSKLDLAGVDLEIVPSFFQQQIPKELEIRATVVGDRVFAAEIHSQETTQTSVDWRRYPLTPVTHRPHILPSEIEEKCVRLVHQFELQYSALDLILTPAHEYVFLELNPNGQWAWIETLTGLPIREAIVNLLCSFEK